MREEGRKKNSFRKEGGKEGRNSLVSHHTQKSISDGLKS